MPAGEPFGVRMIETFDGARTKEFNLYVDDVPVGRYVVKRTQGGLGWLAHDILIDSPAALEATADGKARLKIEFPTDATDFDPSVADLWVLPGVTKDTAPPAVGARPVGTAGRDGWFTGPVRVEVDALDDYDEEPVVEVQDGADWAPYVAPVELTSDGEPHRHLSRRRRVGQRLRARLGRGEDRPHRAGHHLRGRPPVDQRRGGPGAPDRHRRHQWCRHHHGEDRRR